MKYVQFSKHGKQTDVAVSPATDGRFDATAKTPAVIVSRPRPIASSPDRNELLGRSTDHPFLNWFLKQLAGEVATLRSLTSPHGIIRHSEPVHAQAGSTSDLENRMGRLMVKEGKCRYIGDEISAALGAMQYYLVFTGPFGSLHGGFFGSSTSSRNFTDSIYPPPAQIPVLWRIYQDNVAPMIAILHLPSVDRVIREASSNVALCPAYEALVISVCFAAVVSMKPEQCLSVLGQKHKAAIKEYGHAVDQALGRANLIRSQDFVVLQAAVLFLLCLRPRGDTRLVWAESAVIVRIAQGQGVHRDGRNFGLSPFETEVRRRLWWHICILDMLCSEDQGMDTQIKPGMFDTRPPSSIDVNDLTPHLIEPPPEKISYTDITLCIVQCEVIMNKYRLDSSTARERKIFVESLGKRLQDRYLNHFDLDIPIHWVVAVIARLTLSRSWLAMQFPPSSASSSSEVFPTTQKPTSSLIEQKESPGPLFQTAVESVNFSHLLQSNKITSKWAWLAKSYKQWHVVAFILSELCIRPINPETDFAWDVISKMYQQWEQDVPHTNAILREPLAALMQRAASSRAHKSEEASRGRGNIHRSAPPVGIQPPPTLENAGFERKTVTVPAYPGFSGLGYCFPG
ncbi:hypothetical protein BBP40_012751 [Aspergillus hancockii]|nr:hypothetical protein BBP40_012751 [Aspergillus hancockii]